ncbi:MAG: protein kinase [Vicinamibacterales bacterium]
MRLSPGDRLGSYEVLSLIGSGGMGEIYRARDPRLDREIALKVLSKDVGSDPSALVRFQQEARAAAALNHPNIIAVHDIGTHAGCAFIVSELLQGETLRDLLVKRPLPPPVTLDYARQIADGLEAAHDKGIVHRDLKPENIFITRGQLKILDFGLARLTPAVQTTQDDQTAAGSPTTAGTVLGTAGYMSPEQVRAEPADHRADLFSFGAVLYEMLAGRRAFAGRTPIESMSAILKDDPPDLPHASDVASGLLRVARRCLEKRPEARFQSAHDLRFALAGIEARPAATLTPPVPGRWMRRGVAIGALLSLAAIAGALIYRPLTNSRAPVPRIESLAVLPLRNLSNDPGQEYFADGMTEELISTLNRIGGISVTSRTSSMTFKTTTASLRLPEIAGQLGVDAVIEGSVARVADRVRISVQLIQAATDTPLWSNSYERDLGDVLSLQATVAREIAHEIKVTLTPLEEQRLAVAPAIDRAAHEDYLRGRFLLARGTEESLNRAIGAFTAAAAKEPGYARAYAGLADAYTALRSIYLPPHVVMPKAKAAAAKALELDPDLAEAHVSMGGVLMFYDFDWTRAEVHLKRAIELSPSLADAHDYYALYLAAVGRHDQARASAARARELDPLSLTILGDSGWVYYLARDYAKALEMDQKALDIDPEFWPALRDLGLAYEKLGRYPEAVAALQKARSIDANPSILEMLGGAYASWGKIDEARQVLAELTVASRQRYVCPFEVATVHAALGDRKAALGWLEKGYADRADCMPWARSDPKLDGMKGYPGFDELIRRVGFPR